MEPSKVIAFEQVLGQMEDAAPRQTSRLYGGAGQQAFVSVSGPQQLEALSEGLDRAAFRGVVLAGASAGTKLGQTKGNAFAERITRVLDPRSVFSNGAIKNFA